MKGTNQARSRQMIRSKEFMTDSHYSNIKVTKLRKEKINLASFKVQLHQIFVKSIESKQYTKCRSIWITHFPKLHFMQFG